jgi:hypothetical protein
MFFAESKVKTKEDKIAYNFCGHIRYEESIELGRLLSKVGLGTIENQMAALATDPYLLLTLLQPMIKSV